MVCSSGEPGAGGGRAERRRRWCSCWGDMRSVSGGGGEVEDAEVEFGVEGFGDGGVQGGKRERTDQVGLLRRDLTLMRGCLGPDLIL
jgi:hypothetical protein